MQIFDLLQHAALGSAAAVFAGGTFAGDPTLTSHRSPMSELPPEEQNLPQAELSTESAPKEPARFDAGLASELTLGLLHNANNSMTGLFFTLESCLDDEYELPEGMREQLDQVLDGLRATQAIVDRASEMHLGVREVSYHEAGHLLRSQADLVKIVLPPNSVTQMQTAPEALHLQIDEAGFRRLLLEIVRWFRPALVRPPRLVIGTRAATLAASGPAVAFFFEAPVENIGTPPASLDAASYGGEIVVTRPPSSRSVEIALVLPRVELESRH